MSRCYGVARVPYVCLVLTALLPSVSGVCAAEQGAQFWAAQTAYWNAQKTISEHVRNEADQAASFRVDEYTWERCLAGMGTGKEIDPVRDLARHALLTLRIRYSVLGHKVDQLEKDLRAFWASQYKPNRTADFHILYQRFMGEGKYADALRIAEECYRDYGWSWEARRWLEIIIATLPYLPEQRDQLSARMQEYHDKHLTALGASDTMSAGLGHLLAKGKLDQAARLVESCLAAYKDCTWEPEFLDLAVTIHAARAATLGTASTGEVARVIQSSARMLPSAAWPAAPSTTSKAKPVILRRPPVTPARPASAVNSTERLAYAAMRCAEVYPHEPACAAAIVKYMQWAVTAGREPARREEAGQVVAKYLSTYRKTPAWSVLYTAGKSWVEKGDPSWQALAAVAQGCAAAETNRNDQLQPMLESARKDRLSQAESLSRFVASNPDTVQARRAFEALTVLVLDNGSAEADRRTILAMSTNALNVAFPASRLYQRRQLAKLCKSGVEPECTRIAAMLIDMSGNLLQKEWACYWGHARFIECGTYSVPAFQSWVKQCPDSYLIPEQLALVTARALYDGKRELASEACESAYREFGTSLVMADQVGENLRSWLPFTYDQAVQNEQVGKAVAKRKEAAMGEREARAMANAQANCIDGAQSGKTDLSWFYWCTMTWGDSVQFLTKRGSTPKQVLRSKECRDGFYYYYSKAYETGK